MPTKHLTFPGLVANADGDVSGTHDESPPLNVALERVVVKSTSGCEHRNHDLTAGFSGGAAFNYDGTITDCTELDINLGSLPAPASTNTRMSFTIKGYRPGESVDLEGTLYWSISFFEFHRLLERVTELELRVATLEPKN